MQQKDIKRRAYAASLSLLGGKSSKMPMLGQQMPNFGEYCQERDFSRHKKSLPKTEATKRGSSQPLDTADTESSPASAQHMHRTSASMTPTPPKSQISNDHECNPAGRFKAVDCSFHNADKACKQPTEKQKAQQRRTKIQQGQIKAKDGHRLAKRAAEDECPSREARTSTPALDPVKQPTPKAQQASRLQARGEEQDQPALFQSTEDGDMASAQRHKAELLRDLVKRLEGKAEKVALDLRLEHATQKMRASKAQASLDGEPELNGGRCCPQELHASTEKLSSAPLRIKPLSPDKQLPDKSKGTAANLAGERHQPGGLGAKDATEAAAMMQTCESLTKSPAFQLQRGRLMLGSLSTKTKDDTSRACCFEPRKCHASKSDCAAQSPFPNLESKKVHSESPGWGSQILDPSYIFGRGLNTPTSDHMPIKDSMGNDFQHYHCPYSSSPDRQRGTKVIQSPDDRIRICTT